MSIALTFVVVGCQFNLTGPGGAGDASVGDLVDAGATATDAIAIADATRPPPDAEDKEAAIGLVPSGAPSVTDELGGTGGSPFAADCPDHAVVVGIDAEDNDFGLCQVRAICRHLELDDRGVVTLTGLDHTDRFGSETSVYDIDPVECPDGEIVVGFRGSFNSAGLVRHLRLQCAEVTWDGTDYHVGPGADIPSDLGRPSGFGAGNGHCPDHTIAAGITGRAGSILDRFALRCYELEPIYR